MNNSQMWNWNTRMFITEAKMNLSVEAQGGDPAKYTQAEIDALEKTLKDHEIWLNEMVEKQKAVKMNEDPVLESSELKTKAKVLENHLQKLVRRKVPRRKPSSTTSSSSSTASESASSTAEKPQETKGHDEL